MPDDSLVPAEKRNGHKLQWTKTLAVMASKAIASGGGTTYNIVRLSDWHCSLGWLITGTALAVASETAVSLNKTFSTYKVLTRQKEREFNYKLKTRGKIFYYSSKNIIRISAGIGFICNFYTTNHLARLALVIDPHAPPIFEYHDFRQIIANSLALGISTANIIIYFGKNFKSGLTNVEDFAKYLDENSILDIIKKNKKKLLLGIPVFLGQSACLVFLNMALLPKVLSYFVGEAWGESSWINVLKVPMYFTSIYATGLNRLPQAFFKEHYEESVQDFKQASDYKCRIGFEVAFTLTMLLINAGFSCANISGVISYVLTGFGFDSWFATTLAIFMALAFNGGNILFQWKNFAEFFRDLKKWWMNNFYDEDIENGADNMPKEEEVSIVDNQVEDDDEEMEIISTASHAQSMPFRNQRFYQTNNETDDSDDEKSNFKPSFRG